jgi:hypothetical protein
MAGKHITQANAATLEALHKLLEVGVNGGILIVDSVKGNDIKAGTDSSIPYRTITAAKTAATAGTLILIYPATYNEYDLAKDEITYFLFPNSKIIYSGAIAGAVIFKDNNTSMNFKVFGNGTIENNGTGDGNDVIYTQHASTVFTIDCDTLKSTNNRVVANYNSDVNVSCKSIISGDGSIDQIGGTDGTAKTTIHCNTITSTASYCIEHDGGELNIYADKLTALGINACITTADGNGTLNIDCNKINSQSVGIQGDSATTIITIENANFNTVGDNFSTANANILFVNNCRNGNNSILTGAGGVNYIGNSKPYKIYRALISQSGTFAPTAIILENTLGFVPTWLYLGAGSYNIVQTFDTSKTFVLANLSQYSSEFRVFLDGVEGNDTSLITVTISAGNINGDWKIPIEIIVYP